MEFQENKQPPNSSLDIQPQILIEKGIANISIQENADIAKNAGNEAFKKGKFDEAVGFYSDAIKLQPEWHLPYSNRAMCAAKQGKWEDVKKDATTCIKLAPSGFLKGHYWYAKALIEQKEYNHAMKSLSDVVDKLSLEEGQELRGLLNEAAQRKHESGGSVKTDQRKLSIREFDTVSELGEGNFTSVVHVKHKATKEHFAMKCIEKATAKRTSRRHPNIYNEIHMERRALIKCTGCPNIVHLFHTFQDYYCLYYMMELCEGGEVWKKLVEDGSMVGCHESLARFYIAEVLSAVRFIHSHGMVHRDLKPENMMLSLDGHVKLIDFGTVKDLIDTDLNGPEFVGTPEFMSPQAVLSLECGKESDLWALGCCTFQFFCGYTPFKAPSPFLSFTRIKMPNHTILYPAVIPPDTRDLISKLLVYDPQQRLGSGESGIQALQQHTFFAEFDLENIGLKPATILPKLKELCVRAAGRFAIQLGNLSNVDGPAENSRFLNLCTDEKVRVMHYLERKGELKNPRIFRLFHQNSSDAKCLKASAETREFLGMDYQSQGQWSDPFFFVHIGDPQFGIRTCDASGKGGSSWETEAENLRQAVKAVNRLRPRFVVVSGDFTNAFPNEPDFESQLADFKTIISKISASIPILFLPGNHDIGNFPSLENIARYKKSFGADYYSFWYGGVKGLVLNSTLFFSPEGEELSVLQEMENWLEEQVAFSQYSCQHLLIFMHHPIYVHSITEPDKFVNVASDVPLEISWSVPARHRQKLLDKLHASTLRCIFSGHLHCNNIKILKSSPPPEVTEKDKKTKQNNKPVSSIQSEAQDCAAESPKMVPANSQQTEFESIFQEPQNRSGPTTEEVSSESEPEAPDAEEEKQEVKVRMITTNSVGMSINPNEGCGIRVVKVYQYEVIDEYYTLDAIPTKISL